MLTPRASSSREYLRLDGLWRFRFDTGEAARHRHGAAVVARAAARNARNAGPGQL